MPSANGVYSLPPGYLAVTGATIQASQHNPPLEDIAAALTLRLSRDGTAPMTGPLQFASGTVGLPGLTFAVDPSTGLLKTTNGLGITVGGTQVAEFTPAGMASGVRMLGEIVAWGRPAVPNSLWVFPVGQTLSRTTYPTLWTQVQADIAAGSTFFNNGDGIATFGLPDMRGRVLVGRDTMGGTAAGRLTTAGGGIDGTTIGAVGGSQTKTIVTANLPPYTPSGSITNGAITVTSNAQGVGGGVNLYNQQLGSVGSVTQTLTASQAASTFTGTAQGGSSTPMSVVPPAIVCQFILFIGAPG